MFVVKSNFMQVKQIAIALFFAQPLVMGGGAFAQSIAPTQGNGNLGTIVTPDIKNAQQLNITGGTQAAANLYHSFQKFGLSQGEIANFVANPSIQNILARVAGGNPSVINGLIQVGGNANLYLLNPAGIIFGSGASLNVPASFTATTANGIQLSNGWFGMNTGIDAIKQLTGNPQAFGLANSVSGLPQNNPPAAIVNAGNLSVKEGQSITLVGGLVINTGTIASPSGKITIAAVPNGKYVKITPEGSLLSLELPIATQTELSTSPMLAKDLPNLLTGSAYLRQITKLDIDGSGNLLVSGSAIPNRAGMAVASGKLDVSSTTAKGGEINVLGDRVGLVSAKLDASGAFGGGNVLVGGDLQGKGIVPNSQYTFVTQDSTIHADATNQGNGGKVILWSDRTTAYLGSIWARGGKITGNGGFVEVSGKENLIFQGKVDTTAFHGTVGKLLLDPNNITISSNPSDPLVATQLNSQIIAFADFAGTDININDADLRGISGDVILQAANNIILDSTASLFNAAANSITFQANNNIFINVPVGGFSLGSPLTALSFIAGNNINVDTSAIDTNAFSSSFLFGVKTSPTLSLTAQNGSINISGNFMIRNNPTSGGITLNLNAPNGSVLVDNGFLRVGQVNGATDSIVNITAGRFRVTGTPINGSAGFIAQDAKYSIYTFAANAGTASQGNVSLQFGNQAPIISGNGGNNLINIHLLSDTSFVVGKTPTTSGVDGQIGIGISSIPPQVLTLLSDRDFGSNVNLIGDNATASTLNSNAIAAARTAELQANTGDVKKCEPVKNKKPILTLTASLPSNDATRSAQNSNPNNLPPCQE
ncbi:filamentous hemagglutinin N-terminal domain-containing protein [Pseudanabaena catenata USMAC16]|uniref:Filamentous hemagglutinin family outer membrane protein n=3 Tax=Pseudanabaena TaxID=1152 RepID=L8N066_9CYAN|nr:filamentous hemagglutinin N-terminal domain-containing protein [Pseudanabaena catenata]ELS32424.1 filamentous hemagglutinin family outer membrane protein [Pseudanabaena biceps PCC 7429]MDG3495346.1 filamentous hemagglutinin N-terminal domain-containing protein [Pseudanabaena catenata USMAC16]